MSFCANNYNFTQICRFSCISDQARLDKCLFIAADLHVAVAGLNSKDFLTAP